VFVTRLQMCSIFLNLKKNSDKEGYCTTLVVRSACHWSRLEPGLLYKHTEVPCRRYTWYPTLSL